MPLHGPTKWAKQVLDVVSSPVFREGDEEDVVSGEGSCRRDGVGLQWLPQPLRVGEGQGGWGGAVRWGGGAVRTNGQVLSGRWRRCHRWK